MATKKLSKVSELLAQATIEQDIIDVINYVNSVEIVDDGTKNLISGILAHHWDSLQKGVAPVVGRNDLAWVRQAVSSYKTRKHLSAMYISDGNVVATDGHRLHLKSVGCDLSAGQSPYISAKFKGSRAKIEHINPMGEGEPIPTPPPYDQVMPRREDCNVIKDVKLGNLIMDVTANLALVKIGPAWLNAQYVREALAGSGSWDVYYQGSLDSVMFVCSDGEKVAVVMPIRH